MRDALGDGKRSPGLRRPRLVGAFGSPNSYGLVLLLILTTYVISAQWDEGPIASVVIVVQIAAVWVVFRASEAPRRMRVLAGASIVISALAAALNLIIPGEVADRGLMPVISGALYLAAPFSIVRHLAMRRTVDRETVLGAIAVYLMVGMSFAFAYGAVGALQAGPFFGSSGDGTFAQILFFSFTTLTTTGYGNLVPATNPGQSFAVLEMLIGQLFLVTAVAKVVSAWRPQRRMIAPEPEPPAETPSPPVPG